MRSTPVTLVLAVLIAACDGKDEGAFAVGTLERDRLELVAEASEPLRAIHAREGDRVEAGQLLLELESEATDARVAAATAQVSSAENRLAELTHGPRQEEILEVRARLDGATSAHESEAREYERIEELVRRKLLSPSALDRQRATRDRAEAERRQAHAELALLLKGTRIEELDQARDAVKAAQAQLRQELVVQDRLKVRAPRSGLVEALPYKLGERPPVGAPVLVMLADGDTYARIYVPAHLRATLRPGAAARVTIDGYAKGFTGRVRYVAAEAAFTPYYALTQEDRGRLSYLAEVTLTDTGAGELPAGLPVEVRFPGETGPP